MATKGSKHDLYDVSDSTDWLTTPLAQFAEVESSLRCQVCKDFFMTPMITSCSHTFCSLCIRRCLVNDGKCPACRAPDQELKLRSNASLEGLVEAFQRARPSALEYARSHHKPKSSTSPKRKFDATEGDGEVGSQTKKRTRSSNRISSRQGEWSRITTLDEVSDEDYKPDLDDGFVACPICDTRMKIELINVHLDRCTGGPQAKVASKTTVMAPFPQMSIKPPERLPQLSYSLFKESALRKKLADMGISAAGNRGLLERRHTEWVTLWNANCDSSKPRRKVDLLQDLEVWERTQGGRVPTGSGLSVGNNIRNKDFDSARWSEKYDDSFQNLITSARENINRSVHASVVEFEEISATESDPKGSTSEGRQELDKGMLSSPQKQFLFITERDTTQVASDSQSSHLEVGDPKNGETATSSLTGQTPQHNLETDKNAHLGLKMTAVPDRC